MPKLGKLTLVSHGVSGQIIPANSMKFMTHATARILPTLIVALAGMTFALLMTACGSKEKAKSESASSESEQSEDPKKGTFTVNGKTYEGKVSVQTFPATGEFSVLCQDDAVGLVQITFKNETTARIPQQFKFDKALASGNKDATVINASFMPFGGGSSVDSVGGKSGTATSSKTAQGNEISFENIELESPDGNVKLPVSAKVNY